MTAKTTKGAVRHWLFKTEPESFGFDDLAAAPRKRTGWDGVRNHQARNFLRDDVAVGDLVLVYHSSSDPSGVAGVARVSRAAHPDPTQFDPRSHHFDAKSKREAPTWVQVELEAVRPLARFVSLAEIRAEPALAGMLVTKRGQRLSIQPVRPEEFAVVCRLGGLGRGDF